MTQNNQQTQQPVVKVGDLTMEQLVGVISTVVSQAVVAATPQQPVAPTAPVAPAQPSMTEKVTGHAKTAGYVVSDSIRLAGAGVETGANFVADLIRSGGAMVNAAANFTADSIDSALKRPEGADTALSSLLEKYKK